MKRLLRSIVDVDGKTPQEQLVGNFQRLNGSGLEWTRPEDQRIFDFVLHYFQQRMEVPSIQTLRDYFEGIGEIGDLEATERLKDLEGTQGYVRTNFAHLLHTLKEDQNKAKAIGYLKEAHEIITKGIEVKEGREKVRKHGVKDAAIYVSSHVIELVQSDSMSRTEGNIRRDGKEVWDEYTNAEVNHANVWGRLSGIDEIDKVCHGLKPGELWVHAAFPGELKSAWACNWAYNLATRYRANTVYFNLEMPYEQVRRNFYALHSANGIWRGVHAPLDYRAIRDGTLTEDEKQFYKAVVEDFNNNPEYCDIHIVCPDRDVTVPDIRLKAEMINKQSDVGLVIIDHGQLVTPTYRSKDYVIELNGVVRDSKKMALFFNNGQKVPVLMLFQLNRQGKDDADKHDGIYRTSAISYANEIEKSADVITTTYLNDEHRANGTTKVCNLKNRDNPIVAPFVAKVDFEPRRIRSMITVEDQKRGMGIEEQEASVYGLFDGQLSI